MRYHIHHTTTYTYSQAVILNPHRVRLQPRCDPFQVLEQTSVTLDPIPLGQSVILDALGNSILRCWWSPRPVERLTVMAHSVVVTSCTNPFNYLLEPWATQLPFDYPRSLLPALSPYLESEELGGSPSVAEFAQDLMLEHRRNPQEFLFGLNQYIYHHCQYVSRLEGPPQPPYYTLKHQSGCCRDFVLLFMAACRAVGLAARFVSGYEQGDLKQEQTLHAWAEVYLPGAGWRGYDPTLGLVVCDRHVAIAAHYRPLAAAPIAGTHQGQASATLTSKVRILTDELEIKV
ncbi:transglutaminase family protein [Lyngbya confervoides]|uniref:Transglutaminase family protein n=1 Tax=Lyngbya confervoides BDU141951 TaxID=1574623 RepID=A0ABD4T819_9CYAN|nr:transglutaminase family protein [Lyngbya confervoides]MCM1984701.1 transglutaminase family protein [Lyngbya confervoides BDU141951]